MPRNQAARIKKKSQPATGQHKWKGRSILIMTGLVVVAGCLVLRNYLGETQAGAQTGGFLGLGESKNSPKESDSQEKITTAKSARPEHPRHDVMALVNGKDINRAQLSHACVERYGEEVLESLVNKRLILHHCNNRGIVVTQEELGIEIQRMAKRFKLGHEQWLELLEKERGISPQEYARDILWPTLALKKLAADQLQVDEDEIRKAYETQFGEAVRARLIVISGAEEARTLHRQLTERPEEFARLAMTHSEDVNSASIGGLIQPIRRNMGDKAIEQAVFSLKPGQISQIIPIAEQFAILKCEERLPPQNVPLDQIREELVEQIKEDKLRDVASDKFAELQKSAVIQNVWNDPSLRDRMPGIVATVNGEEITMKQLGDECLLRHGKEVLEVEISHVLLQQALTKSGFSITQEIIDQEIIHAATLAGVVDQEGRADFEKWFQMATKEQGVTRDIYLRDSVWPSAALKKLTGNSVRVDQEDLEKGFAANYGERVRCRAIVLHNMRRAMEVWGKARNNPSMEYFGDLAAEYSIEPTSKSLRGEVPPIRHYSGQPQLEKKAFALQPGQLSEVIQLGDRYVILKCEGRTEPVELEIEEVQHVLQQDILEKKLRIAMSEKYDQIRGKSQIDNYLAGTSQTPQKERVDPAVQPVSANLRN